MLGKYLRSIVAGETEKVVEIGKIGKLGQFTSTLPLKNILWHEKSCWIWKWLFQESQIPQQFHHTCTGKLPKLVKFVNFDNFLCFTFHMWAYMCPKNLAYHWPRSQPQPMYKDAVSIKLFPRKRTFLWEFHDWSHVSRERGKIWKMLKLLESRIWIF